MLRVAAPLEDSNRYDRVEVWNAEAAWKSCIRDGKLLNLD
jgi:hypothetical protein